MGYACVLRSIWEMSRNLCHPCHTHLGAQLIQWNGALHRSPTQFMLFFIFNLLWAHVVEFLEVKPAICSNATALRWHCFLLDSLTPPFKDNPWSWDVWGFLFFLSQDLFIYLREKEHRGRGRGRGGERILKQAPHRAWSPKRAQCGARSQDLR